MAVTAASRVLPCTSTPPPQDQYTSLTYDVPDNCEMSCTTFKVTKAGVDTDRANWNPPAELIQGCRKIVTASKMRLAQ